MNSAYLKLNTLMTPHPYIINPDIVNKIQCRPYFIFV